MFKNAIQSFLRMFGLRLTKASARVMPVLPFNVLEYVLFQVVQESKSAFRFIQLGGGERLRGDDLAPLIRKFGITGCLVESRAPVLDKLKAQLDDQPQITFRAAVPGRQDNLEHLCKYLGYDSLHLLYVDVDGVEDTVIYQALDAGILPAVINYGWTRMPIDRGADLKLRLLDHGYRFVDVGPDTICVRQ